MTDTTSPVRSRLLVIEDNRPDQLIYKRTLADFDIVFADSGEAGLDLLDREPFDLVVLDYQLPSINGDEVLRRIRDALGLETPVVIVTGGGSENVAVEMIRKGANDYVTKDELQTPRVATAVRGAIQRHKLLLARRQAEAELRQQKAELESTIRQLREAQAHLVQSEKMSSLGQLVAGIAHEINNPLAYVSNNLAVLDRDVRHIADMIDRYRGHFRDQIPREILDLEERLDINYTVTNLDRLLRSSRMGLQRVREIVGGLRDFSRLDEAEQKWIQPNDAVKSTLEMVRYHVRQKGVELAVDLAEMPEICCYAGKLNQVLLNLLMNAIQAVQSGATIKVSTSFNLDTDEACFAIEDNGIGIPEAIKTRIFDPFFTTKPQGVGTGLGLWITYNIVKEHDGRIELDSEPGVGTTFRVILPRKLPGAPC